MKTYTFNPQPDITAYELANLVLLKENPCAFKGILPIGLERHLKEVPQPDKPKSTWDKLKDFFTK